MMSIAQAMLAEYEHEAKTTRRFLERIPADQLLWKPHEKSHSAGTLGLHIANVPGAVVQTAVLDEAPLPDFAKIFKQPGSAQEILASHDNSVEIVRRVLPTLDDARLMTNWSGMRDGKPVMTMPKVTFIRMIMLNHWIHHRGQLGVYLRLMGAKVPSSYGPSGDEG
jgi:uncharacterized damage-inducible protein DinB